MSESQGPFNQGPSEQEIRDGYLQALGLPPEAEPGATMAHIGTPELGEMAYEMRARELGAPLPQGEKDLPFPGATSDPIAPITHGLEFIEDHMREPGPPPTPSKAVLDEIRRAGEQLRAERGDTPPEPSATQNLPPAADR